MEHTTIANGATGLAVRTILNDELGELLSLPAATMIVAANAAAILAIPDEYKVAGKLVLQVDTKTVYQWNGSAWIDTDLVLQSLKTSWSDFNLDPTVTMAEGRLAWDKDAGTLMLGMPGGDVNLQIGQEMILKAKNVEADTVTNGTVVFSYGATGQTPTIKRADATNHDDAIRTIGVATEDIGHNQNGYVTVFGIVRDINTEGMTEGALIWLSETAGEFTETRPTQPATGVAIGIVLYAHATEGKIFVHPNLVPNLSRLSDVLVGDIAEGDLLYWDDTAKVWKPRSAKFGAVDAGNYSEFEADGTLKFNGDATVWNDLIIAATNLRPGGSAPTFALIRNGIYGYRFDAGSANELHGAVEVQHDYKEGSDLFVHVHWEPTTTNTGNIVWGFEYSVANPGATFPATTTATMTPAAAPGVIGRHVLSSIVQITGTGLKIGAIVMFRVFRQNGGTDTFTGNAFLHSVGIHYEADTAGSRQIATK